VVFFFFFKQKTAYEIRLSLVGSEMCIRDRLYNALKDRKYDLAIMRSLGASRGRLFVHVILEGILITFLGGLFGFLLGHGLVEILASYYEKSEEVGISGLVFVSQEWIVLLLSLGVGILSALLPAMNAYRTDISKVLAQD